MLHRFYTLNIPDSLSVRAYSERLHRTIITDDHGYACILFFFSFFLSFLLPMFFESPLTFEDILSPHDPSLTHPEALQIDGVISSSPSSEVRLRERPVASDAARFFWEMQDYQADYLFFWNYLFPGDRGHVFPILLSDEHPCELSGMAPAPFSSLSFSLCLYFPLTSHLLSPSMPRI